VKYVITKKKDGTYQAAMLLPAGDGSVSAIGKGLSAAEATVAAARAAKGKLAASPAAQSAPAQAAAAAKKANTVQVLAKVAQNPTIKSALLQGGLEAAKAAASFIPGGGLALKALDLASKFGPAKKLLSSFLKF
jgi:pectin methylesterase-like acyl-CoA thioesterase